MLLGGERLFSLILTKKCGQRKQSRCGCVSNTLNYRQGGRSLYDILGVESSASQSEIKKAYHRLAKQFHPDVTKKNRSRSQEFQAISAAHKVLSNSDSRCEYDLMGKPPLQSLGLGVDPHSHSPSKRGKATKGGDINTVLGLTFVEAVYGATKEVQVQATRECPSCGGSGAPPETNSMLCGVCKGAGIISLRNGNSDYSANWMDREFLDGVCPQCGGEGVLYRLYCVRCRGVGLAKVQRVVKLKIAPGVDQQSVLRVRGQGDAGRNNGSTGDLLVGFNISNRSDKDGFVREGHHIQSTIEISCWDAILGMKTNVATLYGNKSLNIPPGTQHGQIICIPECGVSKWGGNPNERGDHQVTILLVIPQYVEGSVEQNSLQQLKILEEERRDTKQTQHFLG